MASRMKNKHVPYSHPGGVLQRVYLQEYGVSIAIAAEKMGMPRQRLNDVVRGRRGITADTALRLGRYLGTGAQLWLNMQSHYDLALAEAESGKAVAAIEQIAGV